MPDYPCPQCHQKFLYSSQLQRHMDTHMITGDWICGLCNTLCGRLLTLTHHWRSCCPDMKSIFCLEELKAMSTEDLQETAFRLTLEVSCSEKNPETPGPSNTGSLSSLCVYCNLHVPRGSLEHHLGVHTRRSIAGKFCPSSSSSYICDLCGNGFRFKKSLIFHWRHKCHEILAHCPSEGLLFDNRQLRKLVERLVARAEIESPVIIRDERRKEENGQGDQENSGDEEDEECKASFASIIKPPAACDRRIWNLSNQEEPQKCSFCDKKFHSTGRLKIHENAIHQEDHRKSQNSCELCQMRFSQNRTLLVHLRGPCKAMKIEIPNENKRKKMTKDQLMEVVKEAKTRWKKLFDKKIQDNLRFITEYLDEIDNKKRPELRPITAGKTDSESTELQRFMMDPGQIMFSCEFCKTNFTSSRFLTQHQQVAHPAERRPEQIPRNQLTITATSLIPYFKLPEAKFYDQNGKEHRIGKALEKDNDLEKHLRIVEPGAKVAELERQEFYAVEVLGREPFLVVLKEQELLEICDVDGTMFRFYATDPKEFDDLPKLSPEN